jgi:superfamily II DNA or RNA helicase
MSITIELLPSGRLAVRFAYDAEKVRRIKRLRFPRWVKAQRYWEVEAAELPALVKLFALDEQAVPEALRETLRTGSAGGEVEIRLDPTEARIVGSGYPLDAVDAATSFLVPGHRFSPKYKSGQWDGRRRLFSPRTQKFPAGLWPRVRDALDKARVPYRVRTVAAPPPADIAFAPPVTPLRPYQQEALQSAVEAGRGIVQIATGGGKTLLAAWVIRELSRPTVFFVHTRELLYQTRDVLRRELGGPAVGMLGDGEVEIAPVMAATLQTAARLFDVPLERGEDAEPGEEAAAERELTRAELREAARRALESAQVIIFDECHHVPAETCFRLTKKMKAAYFRFGLSATPWTTAERDVLLEAALGGSLCRLTGSALIRQGYLVAPEITMRAAPQAKLPRGRLSYADVYRVAIVENLMRNTMIAATARQEAAEGRTVLILVAQVRHGELLRSLLPEAAFSYGSLDTGTRRDQVEALRSRSRPVLIATTLADEGLDIPTLDTLILAGGGKSAVRAYQRVGRTLRPAEGKQKARVVDFFDRAPFLGDHSMERLRLYRREPAFRVKTVGFGG